jgi:hypothetical protein
LWLIASVLCFEFFNRWYFDKFLNAGSTGSPLPSSELSCWVEKNLFADGFLRVADFILNLPNYLFGNTLAFQVGIVRQLAHLFLDLALYFVNLACDFILNAWLHLADSCAEIRLAAEGENT